jgi:hypothetical protein
MASIPQKPKDNAPGAVNNIVINGSEYVAGENFPFDFGL